ncbi:hypothetical protein SOVF_091310 [Spinacia oleracea]|nr:hypothetical protein SOVF_091310 [Spinacia oleracea]
MKEAVKHNSTSNEESDCIWTSTSGSVYRSCEAYSTSMKPPNFLQLGFGIVFGSLSFCLCSQSLLQSSSIMNRK